MINTPIIVVHGIMGSWLKNQYEVDYQDEIYWDAILRRKYNNIHLNSKNFMVDKTFDKLVFPHQSIPLVYSNLVQELQSEVSKYTYSFTYDWRKDNRYSAKLLSNFVDMILNKVQIHEEDPSINKVILVGHSMGGLVIKWYAEHILGEKAKDKIDKIISVATPYKGSIKSIEALIPGARKFFGIDFQKSMRKAARTFPGLFQLLPSYDAIIDSKTKESLNIFEIKNWQHSLIDKLNKDFDEEYFQNMLNDAKDFQVKVSKSYEGYLLENFYCVRGKGSHTRCQIYVDTSKGNFYDFESDFGISKEGDGTVPLSSSDCIVSSKSHWFMDRKEIKDVVLGGQHAQMMNHELVQDFIINSIIQKNNLKPFRSTL